MHFRFSGLDRFSLFESIIQFDTEFAEILGGDTFSPFDPESDLKYRRRWKVGNIRIDTFVP